VNKTSKAVGIKEGRNNNVAIKTLMLIIEARANLGLIGAA